MDTLSTTEDLSNLPADSSLSTSSSWSTTWDDEETINGASDETDDEDTLLRSVGADAVVRDKLLASPTPLSPSALAGPFNSTMVEGGVPIQDISPPPITPVGAASSGGRVRLAGESEPAPLQDDAMPSQRVVPDEVPPCPLGLLWQNAAGTDA